MEEIPESEVIHHLWAPLLLPAVAVAVKELRLTLAPEVPEVEARQWGTAVGLLEQEELETWGHFPPPKVFLGGLASPPTVVEAEGPEQSAFQLPVETIMRGASADLESLVISRAA